MAPTSKRKFSRGTSSARSSLVSAAYDPSALPKSTNSFRFDFLLSQLSHIATLGKAEKELCIDIACMHRGGCQEKGEH